MYTIVMGRHLAANGVGDPADRFVAAKMIVSGPKKELKCSGASNFIKNRQPHHESRVLTPWMVTSRSVKFSDGRQDSDNCGIFYK